MARTEDRTSYRGPRSRAPIADKLFHENEPNQEGKREREREREREFREILYDSNELTWYLNQSDAFTVDQVYREGELFSEASGDDT